MKRQRTGALPRAAACLLAIIFIAAATLAVSTHTVKPAHAAVPGRVLAAHETVQLQVTGRAGVPANAKAVALTLTVVQPATAGFLAVWGCGPQMPNASVINFEPGRTTAGVAVVRPGLRGKVCIRTSTRAHVLADASGYLPTTAAYTANATTRRILDSRNSGERLPGGVSRQLDVLGVGGVPANATAVVATFTVVSPLPSGYLTVYPCGQPVPNTSMLNFQRGQTIANAAIVQPGAGGKICIRPSGPAHVLVDVMGSFGPGGYVATAPTRLVDSRAGGAPLRPAGSTLTVPVSPGAAVGLNVTAVGSATNGWITVHPCGTARPSTSNLNFAAGRATANFVLAGPGATGEVCVYTNQSTHIIVDAAGSVPTTATYVATTPTRLLDTRNGVGLPPYTFLDPGPRGQYSRWNRCAQTTIPYRLVNHLGLPASKLDIVRAAFADVSATTGFNFVEAGSVITNDPGDFPYADDYGVLVLAGYDNRFAGNQIGVGGFYATSSYQIVEGFLWLDPNLSRDDSRDVALHELGHMVGLGHSPDPTQLMYYLLMNNHLQYQPGDLDGLAMVGTAMPCVGALRSGPHDRDELRRVVAEH